LLFLSSFVTIGTLSEDN